MTAGGDVAVVGVGVKAPGGTTADELWRSLCSARSTAEPYADERLPADAAVLVSRVSGFDPAGYFSAVERRRLDRALQLALAAAQDAFDDASDGGRAPRGRHPSGAPSSAVSGSEPPRPPRSSTPASPAAACVLSHRSPWPS